MTAKEQSKSGPETDVSGVRDRNGVSKGYLTAAS